MTDISPIDAWILAARPKTLPAAVAPVMVGSAMAAVHKSFALLPATEDRRQKTEDRQQMTESEVRGQITNEKIRSAEVWKIGNPSGTTNGD